MAENCYKIVSLCANPRSVSFLCFGHSDVGSMEIYKRAYSEKLLRLDNIYRLKDVEIKEM